MIISAFKKFHKTQRNLFYTLVIGLAEFANLFILNFFIRKRFIEGIIPVSKLLRIPDGLAGAVMSLAVGGLLVFAVAKLCELISYELKTVKNKLLLTAMPMAFAAVCVVVTIVLWIINKNTFGWICADLAYIAGAAAMYPSASRHLNEIKKKKEEENEPAGFFD